MELIRRYKQGNLTTADVRTLNNAVICLMVVLALTSIVWSITIHIISGDFYHGILGAKLAFRERDFPQMDEHSKEIFFHDLDKLINETYSDAVVNGEIEEDETTPTPLDANATTKQPKVRKTYHIFQVVHPDEVEVKPEDEASEEVTTTVLPAVKFNMTHDRQFLSTMMLDVHKTRWRQSAAVQFIYSFPFLSEIFAIIWTAMCLIFQSGVQKYWGLPKPWRIVIPSILVFSLMTLGTLIYAILASTYLKNLCNGLRENLTKPDAITCGQAIAVLRPFIRQHEFKHDVYLNLFRFAYMFALVMWLLALLLMLLRYFFAIDFQLMDVQSLYENKFARRLSKPEPEFTEVLLDAAQSPTLLLPRNERNKSEDDFQSAKSNLSEVAMPLLDTGKQQLGRAQYARSQQQQRVV
ncbi:uncharacterized protein LOC128855610 isoform X2 [Anastrepha ludens]|uniref:uncharacterized protein LOC128855610 isoform X2 n=1 Tax=Anastrepha ludens TaxID=28586 RepID=UPI0023B14E90|nr:uncharacterized protein LOC128855610 isoform X2 [Anastrepha ludens]XP_053946619.1 uncharacterized protein LOC128855610 isoform X2 [Anastrepha ludens]XP_053946620.1 uncharacterized protein LOC128855610 isoform X2 [Anastrepha ludens]XP_053946622.1 uncharacterized protein LOC128855610 isoform X2 [Anastrepha ludens]XP_053946623.1 uncharacterized protein LOC128855610 isoform X2 [Anastrepha ludens]XP_053946624.1 uncharacterized protein LOC128855610 isoform X2 [Anastrepha ludens]XP_053946625.1 un